MFIRTHIVLPLFAVTGQNLDRSWAGLHIKKVRARLSMLILTHV